MTTQVNSTMTPIQTWHNATPFADRIVAYSSSADYYRGNDPFSLEPARNVHFAYVIHDSAYAISKAQSAVNYSMSRLLGLTGAPRGCPLQDRLLTKYPLEMRLATAEEMVKISEAIATHQAEFEYQFFYQERINRILKEAKIQAFLGSPDTL